jgi:asparagine synthetase B (glutamine-hydrolysing)
MGKWNHVELDAFYENEFDFKNQHKTTYDDWLNAFSNAIKKRAVNGCFMGLSSGYDSGAVSKELSKIVTFKAYTMFNNENVDIIKERLKYVKTYEIASMSQQLWQQYYDFLKGKITEQNLRDPASMGVAYTFETAIKQGYKVFICGQGGDEIISDYALYPGQSTFKGVFPKDLYEWANFRGHMNLEYITEIEDIAKIYGIETHYPFLDVELVQEYLWLDVELKNRNYKAPLREYLIKNNVPFEENKKRGFNPIPR